MIIQVHVCDIDNPEEASFFESFEAAHSSHDLSSSIAEVILLELEVNIFVLFHIFFSFSFSSFRFILQTFLDHYYFMNRNSVSKHHQSELIAKQNMELCQEEMGL